MFVVHSTVASGERVLRNASVAPRQEGVSRPACRKQKGGEGVRDLESRVPLRPASHQYTPRDAPVQQLHAHPVNGGRSRDMSEPPSLELKLQGEPRPKASLRSDAGLHGESAGRCTRRAGREAYRKRWVIQDARPPEVQRAWVVLRGGGAGGFYRVFLISVSQFTTNVTGAVTSCSRVLARTKRRPSRETS